MAGNRAQSGRMHVIGVFDHSGVTLRVVISSMCPGSRAACIHIGDYGGTGEGKRLQLFHMYLPQCGSSKEQAGTTDGALE